MENGSDTKDAVEEVSSEEKPEAMQNIGGEVHIKIDASTGILQLIAPPNQLIALAILKAAEVHITMGMQDAMRRSNAARPPAIVRAGADALSKISRPS